MAQNGVLSRRILPAPTLRRSGFIMSAENPEGSKKHGKSKVEVSQLKMAKKPELKKSEWKKSGKQEQKEKLEMKQTDKQSKKRGAMDALNESEEDEKIGGSFLKGVVAAVKRAIGLEKEKKVAELKSTKLAPFAIPPSKTDLQVFQLKNPFVELVDNHEIEMIDSVDKLQLTKDKPMDVDAIRKINNAVAIPVIRSKTVSPHARTELGYRDIHINLIKNFVDFTVPVKKKVKTVLRSNKKQKVVANDDHEGLYLSVQLEGDTDPEGMELKYEGDGETSGDTDPEGMELKYEGDGETSETIADRFDIKVMVVDKRIEDNNNVVTVAYVECKKDDDALPGSIAQAASYARNAVFQNMQKGRYSPIYLEGFSKTKWKYGMLIPFGMVNLKDGEVESFESIYEQDSEETLTQALRAATTKLYRAYPENKKYPDGVYLSGVLYMDPKEYYLPLQNGEKADALFNQTWLHIIAGKQACHWTVQDVEARSAVRNNNYQETYHLYLQDMAEQRNMS